MHKIVVYGHDLLIKCSVLKFKRSIPCIPFHSNILKETNKTIATTPWATVLIASHRTTALFVPNGFTQTSRRIAHHDKSNKNGNKYTMFESILENYNSFHPPLDDSCVERRLTAGHIRLRWSRHGTTSGCSQMLSTLRGAGLTSLHHQIRW